MADSISSRHPSSFACHRGVLRLNRRLHDDAGLRRQPEDGGGDVRELAGEVSAFLTVDRRGETRFVQPHVVAVEFQLIEPSRARRRRCS